MKNLRTIELTKRIETYLKTLSPVGIKNFPEIF
jgi:hypothetical protein